MGDRYGGYYGYYGGPSNYGYNYNNYNYNYGPQAEPYGDYVSIGRLEFHLAFIDRFTLCKSYQHFRLCICNIL